MIDLTVLPDNSTDRLLLVADIIENYPNNYDQREWCAVRDDDVASRQPWEVLGGGRDWQLGECGSVACLAGWGVLTVDNKMIDRRTWERKRWHEAGSAAFGFTDRLLAERLFSPELQASVADAADILRHLAKLPEAQRDWDQLAAILPPRLVRLLVYTDNPD